MTNFHIKYFCFHIQSENIIVFFTNNLFLSITTNLHSLRIIAGKAIECYSCIIGTPEKNRTSLSSAVKIFAETFPNEFCNKSMDINEYPTCRTQRNCIKSVVEGKFIFFVYTII